MRASARKSIPKKVNEPFFIIRQNGIYTKKMVLGVQKQRENN